MKAFLKRWASNFNYTSGPKVGEPSKIAPAGIAGDGTQPGTGTKVAAEEFNHLMNVLGEVQAVQTVESLAFRHRDPDPSKTTGYHGYYFTGCLGKNPISGNLTTLVWEDTVFELTRVLIDSTGNVSSDGVSGSGSVGSEIASTESSAHCFGHTSADQYMCIGNVSTGDIQVYRAAGASESFALIQTLSSKVQPSMSYDSGNSRAILVCNNVPYYITEAAPTTVAAGSGTFAASGSSENGDHMVASSDDGVSMFGYFDGTSTFRTYKTTDGAAWVAATSLPNSGTPTLEQFKGTWWEKNFLGGGPAFVCVAARRDSGVSELNIHYTRDEGSTWTNLQVPGLALRSAGCQIVGDFLVVAAYEEMQATDLASMKSFALGRIGNEVHGSTYQKISSVGTQLYYADTNGEVYLDPSPQGNASLTGFVKPPLALDGTDLDA